MAWFADLTPYGYSGAEPSPPTLNVGWLEAGRLFPSGDVAPEFVARLKLLPVTLKMRGVHHCDLCPEPPPPPAHTLVKTRLHELGILRPAEPPARPSGTGEIRAVAADGTRFAAPSLIGHYVTAHRYAPPQAFIDAVMRCKQLGWREARERKLCFACGGPLEPLPEELRLHKGESCRGCGVHYFR